MSSKKVLMVGIAIGLLIGIPVGIMLLKNSPRSLVSNSPSRSTPSPSAGRPIVWVAPGGATTTQPYIPTNLLVRALDSIEHTTATVRGFEMGDRHAMLLVNQPSYQFYPNFFLWYIFFRDDGNSVRQIRTFSVDELEMISFTKEGTEVVLTIRRSDWRDAWYHGYAYYRYGIEGREMFAFEMDNADRADEGAKIRNGYGETYHMKLVYSPACESMNPKSAISDTTLIGIEIAGVVHPLPHTKTSCLDDGGLFSSLVGETFTFQEFDPEYDTLALTLPGDRSILVDVNKKQIVPSKQKYNLACLTEGSPLTLTTPSSTLILSPDVSADPVLLSAVPQLGERGETCLFLYSGERTTRPVFQLLLNFGEGYKSYGLYELNTKTKKFRKLK